MKTKPSNAWSQHSPWILWSHHTQKPARELIRQLAQQTRGVMRREMGNQTRGDEVAVRTMMRVGVCSIQRHARNAGCHDQFMFNSMLVQFRCTSFSIMLRAICNYVAMSLPCPMHVTNTYTLIWTIIGVCKVTPLDEHSNLSARARFDERGSPPSGYLWQNPKYSSASEMRPSSVWHNESPFWETYN